MINETQFEADERVRIERVHNEEQNANELAEIAQYEENEAADEYLAGRL